MPDHPFFDAAEFPWPRREAADLHLTVAKLLQIQIVQIVVPKFGGDLTQLNLAGAPAAIWRDVLNHITVVRGLKAFCEWCRDESLARANPAMHNAVQAVFDAEFMKPRRIIDDNSSLLVLDRQQIWSGIARLGAANDRARIMIIEGAKKSGKSYLSCLFELAAKERVRAETIYLTKDLVANVEEVIDALASRIGVTIDIPRTGNVPATTTTPAWYKSAINRLIGAAKQSNTEWWIVVDDLGCDDDGVPLIDESVHLFFKQFGQTFADPYCRKWFRLMLIGLPSVGATKWDKNSFIASRVAEDDVTADHVSEALRECAARKGKSLGPETAVSLATSIVSSARLRYQLTKASADDDSFTSLHSWLHCLHEETLIAMNAL